MAKDFEVTDPYEGILEEPAINFAMTDNFREVTPTSVELHFGAMQLSTAISMKRIADVLRQWIDLVTEEDVEPKQDDLDKAYVDGFKAGQRSRNEAIIKNEIADDELEASRPKINEIDVSLESEFDDDYDPDIDPPEEDPNVDGIVPSKNQMS